MKMELKSSPQLIQDLTGYRGKIYFGVPLESTNRSTDAVDDGGKKRRKKRRKPIDNATILAIMEHGSPVKNIPPRPLLKPVLNKHRDKIFEIFGKVYERLLAGDEQGADRILGVLAQRVQRWTQAFFTEDNGWAPNAPSTIRRKGSDKPLIDTGSLHQSIRGIFVKK